MSEIILCKECSKEVDLRKIPFFCKECEQFRTQITDRQKVREAVEKNRNRVLFDVDYLLPYCIFHLNNNLDCKFALCKKVGICLIKVNHTKLSLQMRYVIYIVIDHRFWLNYMMVVIHFLCPTWCVRRIAARSYSRFDYFVVYHPDFRWDCASCNTYQSSKIKGRFVTCSIQYKFLKGFVVSKQ